MRYREESSGQEHSDFSSCFLMLAISRFQSQLTDFPMYRLAEVEVAALACFKQANTRINMRYREESGGQEHSDFSSCLLMLAISRFQSQLTNFPMYRLAEVEVAALYLRIREVALNRGYQGCFKIMNYTFWIEIDNEDCRFAV
ncbi:hypothetical protein T03_1846 [Trichinella britovi]|uniref:Uncharacterized protein n=1 Tax=Trichinella britovi TaxID=45882 RepID=A0A0V1CBC8_TRIBR|nr:hypothetical protein T03_1846 [Trichinella britovi]